MTQQTTRRMGARCLLCGYDQPLWLGDPPRAGRCIVTGGGMCREAEARAHAEGMRRKLCPDAFDAAGKILPGEMTRVIDAMQAAGLDPWTGRPA